MTGKVLHYTESPITYLTLNHGPTPGVSDAALKVRVISIGRDGNDILARTVRHDEEILDFGINMQAGERLIFPPKKLTISIHDIEQENPEDNNGYAPIANTIWTWLHLPGGMSSTQNQHALYYLESAGRRLDTVYHLCREALGMLKSSGDDISTEPYMQVRTNMFKALGYAELVCVGLHRVIEMVLDLPSRFNVQFDTSTLVRGIAPALAAIRHAIEHIDERAIGNVHQRADRDAYTIFDQREFYISSALQYGNYSLNLNLHILPTILFCRDKLFQAVITQAGDARSNDDLIVALDGRGDAPTDS